MSIDPDEFTARKQSFGAAVDDYDRTRPDYAPDAVAWCLEPAGTAPLRVADVGAGTGKLTGVLLALGHEVVAIEPDEAMLDRLRDHHGGDDRLTAAVGAAEALPLDDESVDVVVCGQAWHWFNEEVVGPEFARVLRPGGVAAAVWNTRDEDVDWVRAWSEVVEEGAHPTGRKLVAHVGGPQFGDAFHAPKHATFRHEHLLERDGVVRLAASRSYTISLPADRRAALLANVTRLVATHPDLVGLGVIPVPYVVECHRALRRA